MQCPKCQSEIPAGAAFCTRCGTRAGAMQTSGGLSKKGNNFVISRGEQLPPRCVKCAEPCTDWLAKTYTWHSPVLYVLLISPLIYIIVALIVRKKFDLAVPLCDAHLGVRKQRLWIGAGLLLGCVPVPILLANMIQGDAIVGFSVLLGFAMFFAGVIFLIMAIPLRATFIDTDSAEFSGAGQPFLAAIG